MLIGGNHNMNKRFIELPEKKMVIAMMEKRHTILEEILPASKKYAFIFNRLDFIFGRKEPSNPYFKSKAIASEDDVFDAKIGREIAGQKVDYKYHKSMICQYNRYILLLEGMINALEELRNKHISERRKIENNMKKY